MEKEEFAKKHAEICSRKNWKKRAKYTCLSNRLACGRQLYDFLTKHNLPLDIRYNQKKINPIK